jgi:CHAT domain-containing protein/Tfp pilus assembly protein PilF
MSIVERLWNRFGPPGVLLPTVASIIVILIVAGASAADPAANKSSEAKATSKSAAAEARQLMEQVGALYTEGKPDEAFEAARQSLTLIRAQRNAQELLPTVLEWAATTAENAEDWPHAKQWREEALAWVVKARGEAHWESIDARIALDDARKRETLSQAQTADRKQADERLERASMLLSQGKYADAATAADEATPFIERVWGKKHRRTADSRLVSGYFSGLAGDFDAAKNHYAEVIAIRKEALGTKHPEYATALNILARLHTDKRDFARAEPLLIECRAIRKEVLGTKHSDYVLSVSHLARLYANMNDYGRAEPLYLEALAIRKETLGTKHADYAVSLSHLASHYSEKGDHARAEPLLVELLTLRKEVLGTKHADYALSLNNLAAHYMTLADYARAEPLFVEARAIRKELHGTKHLDYAVSVNNLASLYSTMGDAARAETLYVEALNVRKDLLGTKHPDYAASLNNLAELFFSRGDYARAEPLFVEALAILKERLGTKHPSYIVSLSNLGALYSHKGEYARAEPLYLEVLKVRKELFGTKHLDYATSLNNLGSLYENMANNAQAEPLYVEALAIRKAALGVKHPAYATSLNNLASLYQKMGDNARAEPLYVEALAIRKAALGAKHPSYATSLNNLAQLYKSNGDYARAVPLYVESLDICKQVGGTKHPDYAASLSNLALLYASMGDVARALPLSVEALDVMKQVLGVEHPDYAFCLNNLGMLYSGTRDFARAEPLLVEARAIRKDILGTKHPEYAVSLSNLAELYSHLGDNSRAEPLLLEAIAIRKEALGTKHPDYATSLNNQAGMYTRMGDYARAEPLYIEVRAIFKEVLGTNHPDYAVCLSNLAMLYLNMSDMARAEPLMREAVRISRASLEATALVQSERQQLTMGRSLRHELDGYISLGAHSGNHARDIFAEVLSWKGATLVRQRGIRNAAGDPAVADLFTQLQRTATQLASLSRSVPGKAAEQAAWRARLAQLTQQKDQLEAELSAKSSQFRNATQPTSLDALLAALPQDAVLVDFLEFNRYTPPKDKGLNATGERQLVAFVIRHAEKAEDQVRMIPLGPVAPIWLAVDAWRKSFGMGPEGEAAGKSLRDAVWQPLLQHIADAKSILVSSDGALGRLPLGALPGKEPGTYLLEDHRLALVPVPQLLPSLMSRDAKRTPSRDLLLMGDVDYGPNFAATPEPSPAQSSDDLFRSAVGGKKESALAKLPETKVEVMMIENKLAEVVAKRGLPAPRVEVLKEAGATVAEFRRLAPDCRYLHLATHGLFAPPSIKSAEHSISPDARSSGSTRLATREAQVVGYAPGLLSGLAFAGANDPPQADREDGILTSDEIASLPLEGVRLVVLSACETGLGATAGGEGLLGVQRAFQVSGAGTTIATLWAVEDLATRVVMERFYENLWEKGLPRLDALREAQLYVLNNPDKLRGGTIVETDSPTKLRASPQLWAAFILSGDWR